MTKKGWGKTLTNNMHQHIKDTYVGGKGTDGHSSTLRESAQNEMNGRMG